ncbi:uncharacterized protein [Ambystoma mexicanum]|uniref:uncharacterized protein n=1 Tax=Ambystoma mexicanum TaxID=8296 RepID=UPI0037E79AA9
MFNAEKCKFCKQELIFFGYIFNSDRVSPDPAKLRDIKNTKAPTSVTEVRSFMGMATYCARFIPDLTTLANPLRELTKKDKKWEWMTQHQQAFQQIKDLLSSTTTIAFFNME